MTSLAERTHVLFHGGSGPWTWVVAALAFAVLAALAVRSSRGLSGGRAATVVVLRLLLAASVVLLALRPVLRHERLAVSAEPVAVVVDASGSMDVRDQPGGASRLARAGEWARAHGSLLDALERDALVDWFASADGELRATTRDEVERGGLVAAGGTDLARTLSSLAERYPGRPRPPVLLLSDGADHGALREALRAGRPASELVEAGGPVVSVLPDDGGFSDLAVDLVAHDPVGFLRTDVTVRARVRAAGLPAADVPVSLVRGGELVAVRTVRVGGDAPSAEVTFTLSPAQVGEALFVVRVPVQAGESVASNNEAPFAVRVVRDRVRVLQVVGRPSWDGRFLRELLKRDPAIDLISFFILRSAWDDPMASVDELSLIPFPVQELFGDKLGGFDLVVFQNFDFEPYGIQYHLDALRRHVAERGGGLAVLGGDLAFGDDYRSADLEALLPVELGSSVAWSGEDVKARATAAGGRHPLLALGLADGAVPAAIDELLPLRGLVTGLAPKPGAQVLLETADGRQAPLVVAGDAGEGRVLVVASDGTWRWSLPMAAAARGTRGYERFWENAIRWLVRDPRASLVVLEADRRRVGPAESVELRARVRDATHAPARGVAARFSVTDASGSLVEVETVETGEDGVARLALAPERPGLYAVTVETAGGKAGPLHVERDDRDHELQDAALGEDVVRALAELSGGSVHRMGDRDVDLPFDLGRDERVESATVWPLWRTWWAWGLIAALACVEWWLRRRWGLA